MPRYKLRPWRLTRCVAGQAFSLWDAADASPGARADRVLPGPATPRVGEWPSPSHPVLSSAGSTFRFVMRTVARWWNRRSAPVICRGLWGAVRHASRGRAELAGGLAQSRLEDRPQRLSCSCKPLRNKTLRRSRQVVEEPRTCYTSDLLQPGSATLGALKETWCDAARGVPSKTSGKVPVLRHRSWKRWRETRPWKGCSPVPK